MRRLISILAVLVLGTAFETAWAGRCLGIPETQIAWCDDFDNYCTANNPSNPWPGYPPSPDTICATDGTAVADADFFRQNWPNVYVALGADSMAPAASPISFSFANSMPIVAVNQHGPISSQYHEYDITSALRRHHPNTDAINGTDATPLKFKMYWRNSQVYGLNRSPFYIELRLGADRAPTDYVWSESCGERYDCNCGHLHRDVTCTYTCVEAQCSAQHFCIGSICQTGPRQGLACTNNDGCYGCVGGPNNGQLCTSDSDCPGYCNGGPKNGQACSDSNKCGTCAGGKYNGKACNDDHYCQTYCNTGDTGGCDIPGDPDDGKACVHDSDCGVLQYPIIAQQSSQAQIPTPHPRPPWTKHKSLAVGWLVGVQWQSCADGNFPAVWHMSTFDGEKWRDLHYGEFTACEGSEAEFENANMSLDAWVTVEIKTSTYILTLESGGKTSCGTVARQYTGPFNMVAMGAGPSCELKAEDTNDWSCKNGAQRVPWAHPWPKDGYGDKQWPDCYLDSATLWDGVYVSLEGACCHENGFCEEVLQSSCQGVHDRFAGPNTTCGDSGYKCCPYPFADADKDHDVDQMDFAAFQLCYGVSPMADGCKCWDRGGTSGVVDADDFTAFSKCWTGPNIHYDNVVPPPPGCVP